MMLYCSTIEFKQKEITFLKSNHSWATWEIMTLYTFVLPEKYAKEYWVSEEYKITNKFDTSHCIRSWSRQFTAMSRKCAESHLHSATMSVQSQLIDIKTDRTVTSHTDYNIMVLTTINIHWYTCCISTAAKVWSTSISTFVTYPVYRMTHGLILSVPEPVISQRSQI